MVLPLIRGGFASVELDLLGTEDHPTNRRFRSVTWNRPSNKSGCGGLRLLGAKATDVQPPDWQALRHAVAAVVSDDPAVNLPAGSCRRGCGDYRPCSWEGALSQSDKLGYQYSRSLIVSCGVAWQIYREVS